MSNNLSQENLALYFKQTADKMGMPPLFKEFTTTHVVSDGIKLHVDVMETGADNPVIVFVPGTAIYAMCYTEVLYKLGQHGYNIVGFDPRGHGRSEGRRGDYTINEIIDDTRAVIKYAAERFNSEITVFGSSQGGIVALYLAAMEMEDVKSVICQNFADLGGEGLERLSRHPRLSKLSKPLLKVGAKLFPYLPIPVTLYLDLAKEKLTHFGDFKQFIEQDPLCLRSIRLRALASLVNTPIPKPINEIKTPVMVIHGTADQIFPVSYTRKIYNQLTCKKRLELYKGLHHTMLVENVDEVLPPLIDWLEEIHNRKRNINIHTQQAV